MSKLSVSDCLKRVDNYFELVLLAAARARDILSGKEAPTIKDKESTTVGVIALKEIAEGTIDVKALEHSLPDILNQDDDMQDLTVSQNVKEEVIISPGGNVVITEEDSIDILVSEEDKQEN